MAVHADVAQLVERNLAKVEVAGSNPVVRSKNTQVSPGSSGAASRQEPACTPRGAEQRVAEHLVGAF